MAATKRTTQEVTMEADSAEAFGRKEQVRYKAPLIAEGFAGL